MERWKGRKEDRKKGMKKQRIVRSNITLDAENEEQERKGKENGSETEIERESETPRQKKTERVTDTE